MRRTLLIAEREFLENVRTKGFWLGVLLVPALMALGLLLPGRLMQHATPTRTFVMVDPTDRYLPLIDAAVGSGPTGSRRPGIGTLGTPAPGLDAPVVTPSAQEPYRRVPLPPGINADADLAVVESRLRPWLTRPGTNGLFAAILVPRDFGPGTTQGVRFWCANQADPYLRDLVERVLRAELRRQEYTRMGLDPVRIQQVEDRPVSLVVLDPTKTDGREQVGLADQIAQWIPSLCTYLLWISILIVSQMLLNSVIEEKANRLIEVLLSSVTPTQLMLGKLTGIAAVGGVLLATWFGSALLLLLPQAMHLVGAAPSPQAQEVTRAVTSLVHGTGLLPAFVFYLIGGYVLYAGLFLAIGSLCNTLKEAQNLLGPLMVLLMVPLFLMPFIPRDPNGPLAMALSWVPPYTPFVMMNRMAAHPPAWQVVGTGILLLASDVLVLWACGRVFRQAILRTGQPPRLREALRWVRSGST